MALSILIAASVLATSAPLACEQFIAGEIVRIAGCARPQPDGSYQVTEQALRRLRFERRSLATVRLAGHFAYVSRSGRALAMADWENGPDEFANGLARTWIGKKLGYADRRLRIVIPARFDGAYPFVNGRAEACIGCKAWSDGKHGGFEGGQQFCIDRRGLRRPLRECAAR